MQIIHRQIKIPIILTLILVLLCVTAPQVNGFNPRKLDEATVPSTNGGEKCVPCGYSSPPPPANPPPPPSPKKSPPSSKYCPPPPPPPSSYIYITGPPGNLYPVVETYNGATRRSFTATVPLFVGLLSLMAFW